MDVCGSTEKLSISLPIILANALCSNFVLRHVGGVLGRNLRVYDNIY